MFPFIFKRLLKCYWFIYLYMYIIEYPTPTELHYTDDKQDMPEIPTKLLFYRSRTQKRK